MSKDLFIPGKPGWRVLNPKRMKRPDEKAAEKTAAIEQENKELKALIANLVERVEKIEQ